METVILTAVLVLYFSITVFVKICYLTILSGFILMKYKSLEYLTIQ